MDKFLKSRYFAEQKLMFEKKAYNCFEIVFHISLNFTLKIFSTFLSAYSHSNVHMHQSATTFKLLTGEVNNMDPLLTM